MNSHFLLGSWNMWKKFATMVVFSASGPKREMSLHDIFNSSAQKWDSPTKPSGVTGKGGGRTGGVWLLFAFFLSKMLRIITSCILLHLVLPNIAKARHLDSNRFSLLRHWTLVMNIPPSTYQERPYNDTLRSLCQVFRKAVLNASGSTCPSWRYSLKNDLRARKHAPPAQSCPCLGKLLRI